MLPIKMYVTFELIKKKHSQNINTSVYSGYFLENVCHIHLKDHSNETVAAFMYYIFGQSGLSSFYTTDLSVRKYSNAASEMSYYFKVNQE